MKATHKIFDNVGESELFIDSKEYKMLVKLHKVFEAKKLPAIIITGSKLNSDEPIQVRIQVTGEAATIEEMVLKLIRTVLINGPAFTTPEKISVMTKITDMFNSYADGLASAM